MRSLRSYILGLLCMTCSASVSAGLLRPYVVHDNLNLRPYQCIASHNVTYWKNRVYLGGASTSGAGPNVWAINVSDPDHLTLERSAGSGYKAYGLKVCDDKLYVANWSTNLRIYDVANGALTHLGEVWVEGNAGWGLDVSNGRVYLAEGTETQSKFIIYDVTNPAAPSTVAIEEIDRSGTPAVRGSYAYYTNNRVFDVLNISDETNPYLLKRIDFGHMLLGSARLRGDYAYLCWSQVTDGGVIIYDVSDPANPVQVGSFAGEAGGDLCLLGDYLFYTTGGNGVVVLDISDPTNPRKVSQMEVPFYALELCCIGNGRYLYVGSLAGENEGWLHSFEVLDSEPDDTGPDTWSGFSMSDASWDTEYLGDELPTASSPAWKVAEGTESLASAAGGELRINDNSASAKLKYAINWDATNTRGTTVLVRARCASLDLNGAMPTNIGNVYIEDGKYSLDFGIMPTGIRAGNRPVYPLDGAQYHTYRITTRGTAFKVYVDEAPAPAIQGTLSTTTYRARVLFGSGSTQALQDVYFDSVQCFSNGVFGPAAVTNDLTPDISVSTADVAGKNSITGVDPSTAKVQWSTDGGQTWEPSGWDCRYEADAIPGTSNPTWYAAEGSETWGSVADGALRVNDTSTASGTKIKWARDWGASPSIGTTIMARARCASTGGDTSLLGNLYIEDGAHYERFKIMTDRIQAGESGGTYLLDGTQWHTYRITTRGSRFRVYIDESPAPVIEGSFSASSSANRVMFGSGASAGTQDIYFDYIYYSTAGEFAPGQGGGAGLPIPCTGEPGDYNCVMTASAVPFNQYSQTQNKVRFSIRDVAGNIAFSPVYNVRIDPNAGPYVTNVTSSQPNGVYKQGATINIQVTFSTNVYFTGAPQLLLGVKQGGKPANCGSGNGTSTLNFVYYVGPDESTPDLGYLDADALVLNGGTIRDVYGSDAHLKLPEPGTTGSLSHNKDIVIDSVRPRVVDVTSDAPDGTHGAGESIDIIVAFSEPVAVTGTPQLALETGDVDRNAVYVSGSGSTTLAFRYAVQLADAAADLDYKATNSLTGTVRDLAGNLANLALPAPGAAGSLGASKDIAIATVGSVAEARGAGVGELVRLGGKMLYLKRSGFGYVEEPDRTAGIRIEGAVTSAEGDLVTLYGVRQATAGGEPFVLLGGMITVGTGAAAPLGAANRSVLEGLMDGLLVKTWGMVKPGSITAGSFVLSDGSDDAGIQVFTNGTPAVADGQFVAVTGAAGIDGGRVIHARQVQ